MIAPTCACITPQVFADSPDACHRCGRSTPQRITASTMRLAIAIAEVAFGIRRVGDGKGGNYAPRPYQVKAQA